MDAKKLARVLDTIRDARHLSWRDVAKVTGLSRATVARLAAGNTQPRAATRERCRRFIGLTQAAFDEQFAVRRT